MTRDQVTLFLVRATITLGCLMIAMIPVVLVLVLMWVGIIPD